MSMRSVKTAIAHALAEDAAIAALIPSEQIHAVERATLPLLPSVEIAGVTSEPQETGALVRHSLSIECTVASADEDAADEALDRIVGAIRTRLADATQQTRPIVREDGEVVPVGLLATRWSVSASGAAGTIRAAAIGCEVGSDDA